MLLGEWFSRTMQLPWSWQWYFFAAVGGRVFHFVHPFSISKHAGKDHHTSLVILEAQKHMLLARKVSQLCSKTPISQFFFFFLGGHQLLDTAYRRDF